MSFAGSASLLIDGSDTTGAGAMGDLQQQVQQAIDELVGTGAERGLQVAVYQDGKQVVEAVLASATPARHDRLFPGDVEQFEVGGACFGVGMPDERVLSPRRPH